MDIMEKVSSKKRLIDADALWRKFESEPWYDNADRDEIALPLVDEAPTVDSVEVVRCRECRYRFKNNGHDKSGCPIIDANIWMDDDDFCSHGERKEGADNG